MEGCLGEVGGVGNGVLEVLVRAVGEVVRMGEERKG